MYEILKNIKSVAIVGLSPDANKDSNIVARYLLENGFKVYPVYPKEDKILGQKVYRKISDIQDKIDAVVMFRKSEYAKQILNEILTLDIKILWLVLGVTNDEVKELALKNGINFIQDRCIKIELQRLKDGLVK